MLVISFSTYSQTEIGKKFIGGQLNISEEDRSWESSSKGSHDQFDFSFRPNCGYFIKDNLAVGADLNFTNSTTHYVYENVDDSKIKSNTYGLGVFARRYVSIYDNFKFFLNGRIGYDYTRESYDSGNGDNTSHTNQISLGVAPGLVYFVNSHISIESQFGSLYYTHSDGVSEENSDAKSHSNDYGISLNTTSLYFGLSYYF